MLSKSFMVFMLTVFCIASLSSLTFAGEIKVQKQLKEQAVNKKVVSDQEERLLNIKAKEALRNYVETKPHAVAEGTMADGDTIGWTVRDFTMNTNMGRKIAIGDNGELHTIYTQWEPNAVDPYHEYYNFADPSIGFFGDLPIDPALNTVQTRSGRVMVGPNGEAWVSFHQHTTNQAYIANDAGIGFYSFTSNNFAAGRFASADYKDGGLNWFTTNDENGDFRVDRFFNSTDGGVTWTQTTNFVALPAGDEIGPVEVYPHFNPVNGDIELFYTNSAASGLSADEAAFLATSSDLGNNWTETEVYREETLLNDGVWYLVENFSQWMSETDASGVTHWAFNGYGFQTDGTSVDSTLYFIYPIVYWNSTMTDFNDRIELTDDIIGRNPALGGGTGPNILADGRTGNAIGNAFPGVATGPDNTVAVLWEQAEIAPGDTTLITATDPTGTPDPAGIYATDLWCAVSNDGGQNWSPSFYIDGVPEKQERSPSIAKTIEKDINGRYWIHYVYMHDPDPGQDLPNPPSAPAAWVYGNFDITDALNAIVGIDDDITSVAKNFDLEQNYPNPFNPSTTISFRLDKAAVIQLAIYNVLGEKVATLVQGQTSAGEHQVQFDANNFTSGIYLYTLKSGNNSITKKMVLLK